MLTAQLATRQDSHIQGFFSMTRRVANSTGRAQGLVISKFKSAKGLPFSTFSKLYDSMLCSIVVFLTTARQCGVAGRFRVFQPFRIGSFVSSYTPNAAVSGDTG